APGRPAAEPQKLMDFLKNTSSVPMGQNGYRFQFEDNKVKNLPADPSLDKDDVVRQLKESQFRNWNYQQYQANAARADQTSNQAGKLGVDLSLQVQGLRNQSKVDYTALRNVYGRNCLEVGGVWIDEGFKPNMETVQIKAMSDAYFRLLEKQPKLGDVFRLS